MGSTSVGARARTRLLLPLAIGALLLAAACTPPPAPEDPNTPWLASGCLDSDVAGVPDFKFSGVANVVGNGLAFLNDGTYVEDGSCTGAESEAGTIVRATTEAGAIAACGDLTIVVHDPGNLAEHGYPAPPDAWACVNETEAPGIVEFSGPSDVVVTIFGGTPEAPTETSVPFAGTGSGTWDQATGDFAMGLQIEDGSFPANSPIGPVTVFYTATQNGTATGSFDPATGEGGFGLDVTMTLVGLNGPTGIAPPCDIGTSFAFEGAIDLATGQVSVSQENFTMTGPGAADCGGLGAIIGPMLTEGTNAAAMTFQVLQP